MPVLILAGLPRSLADRVKAANRKRSKSASGFPPDWNLAFVNTHGKSPSLLESDVERVFQEASKSTGSHVVGISEIAGKSRKQVAKRIRPFFRFRWSDKKLLPLIYNSNPELMDVLFDVIREETCWEEHIKPKDQHHALLLPKGSFNSKCRCQELWEACEAYGDKENINGAIQKIKLFTREYRRRAGNSEKYCWRDSNGLIFDQNGPRHGKAPDWFQWKYSFKLPDGFHYDVSHERQQAFQIKDADCVLHQVARNQHLNLDSHGRVR
ncbi:MAG: hypothetical protein HQL59_06110 [Magnetococcales bacterium]|nr:hypothetical protein [Magnetococcales bacterium]